jgi:hypothetical protein
MERKKFPAADGIVRTAVAYGRIWPSFEFQETARTALETVKNGYEEYQRRYGEDRSQGDFPMRAYGYEIVQWWAGGASTEAKRGISLNFTVKPMPYAHLDSPDGGVSKAACVAFTYDLRDALFKCSPLNFAQPRTEASAELLLDFLFNRKPTDFLFQRSGETGYLDAYATYVEARLWPPRPNGEPLLSHRLPWLD